MDRKDYTPTKLSKFTNISQLNQSTNKTNLDYTRPNPDYTRPNPDHKSNLDYSKPNTDYNHRSFTGNEMGIIKEYEVLKLQVKHLETQNRQLSNEIEKLRYEKNSNENKYLQKVSYEEDAVSQFQKEKNYQLELLKIKNDEEINKVRRDYDFKLDELHRDLRANDYHNREQNQQNSYLQLKSNEIKKRIEILECELIKFRQANSLIADNLNKEEFTKKKLITITEELERQKCQMEAEIHVLLDIEAEKSRAINTLSIQLRNSEATERSLHEKLTNLTDNFGNLQEHIAIMKERLISSDLRNEQLQKQLQTSECHLSEKENAVGFQKQLEVKLRRDLQVQQKRQNRRSKQIQELIGQNEKIEHEINVNRQHLHDLCIAQGIQV